MTIKASRKRANSATCLSLYRPNSLPMASHNRLLVQVNMTGTRLIDLANPMNDTTGRVMGRDWDAIEVDRKASVDTAHAKLRYCLRRMSVLVYVLLTTSRLTLKVRPSCTGGRMHCWSK
ncbi:hypothetical protein RHA1_ro10015 (plasmid) [Rhodococcus jostii RHA1]|uniref:Uncharacterized protein n=1 Tax=Rhodococcus jostii (strain RHA1) TaxID=101510 RepID=Q0RWX8_RHOJR|nr:hypothetical protein RHA1_ro10015 [Rhodococcus jostii RHA1]